MIPNFDATVVFSDGTILNVFINSSGDLESFFYHDEDHFDDQDYCDGSIYELNAQESHDLKVGLAVSLACSMSDYHEAYEKRPYEIREGVEFV